MGTGVLEKPNKNSKLFKPLRPEFLGTKGKGNDGPGDSLPVANEQEPRQLDWVAEPSVRQAFATERIHNGGEDGRMPIQVQRRTATGM